MGIEWLDESPSNSKTDQGIEWLDSETNGTTNGSGNITSDLINNYGADAVQIGGNILGAVAGAGATIPTGGVINPITGSIMGGIAARGAYEGYNQIIDKLSGGKDFSASRMGNELTGGALNELLGFGVAKGFSVAKGAVNGIQDTLKSGKSAKTLLDSLIAQKNSIIKGIEARTTTLNTTKNDLIKNIGENSADDISKLEAQKPALDLNFQNVSKEKTLQLREAYPEFTGRLNQEYGVDWDKALVNEKVPLSKHIQALEKVDNSLNLSNYYDESGNFVPRPEATLSESERKFLRYKKSVVEMKPSSDSGLLDHNGRSLLREPKEIDRPLQDVLSEFQGLFSKKYGTKFGSGEHVITEYKRALADAYDNDAINLVKAKFKGRLQLKNELYKKIQPYNRSGANDTRSGRSFFESVFKGDNPDVNDLLPQLKREFPGLDMSDLSKAHQARVDLGASIEGARAGAKETATKIGENFDKASYIEQFRAARAQQELDELIAVNTSKVEKADKTKGALKGIAKKTVIGGAALWGADKARNLF